LRLVTIVNDQVALGLVASIARPGGNITGVTIGTELELIGKRIELLVEAMPGLSTLGYLVSRSYWEDMRGAATREAAKRARACTGSFWSLKSLQYDNLDGAAWRAIADDESMGSARRRGPLK
jgi:hypothetical protein